MNRLSLFETPLWMTELDLDLNSLENKIKLFSDETESKKLSNVGGYQGHNFHDETLYNSIANCIPVNKNKSLEIDKIKISDISKDLGVPKESVRRKVLELENQKIIKKTGKKIFVVRDTLYSAKAVETLTEVATILHEFNKILKKEKLVTKVYSINEIILAIKENFSYCLYQFNKFWFIYIGRWREQVKDLETLCIGMVVVINAVKNKDFTPKKNMGSFHKELMGSDNRGVNAMSISEITGIPRPTVVRKLKFLIDKKYLHINEKKLITFDAKDSAFQKTGKMINQNILSLSNFIYKIFNQIRIINP